MKKLEIIIRPEKLEPLKEALNKIGVKGMMITSIMGCGNQKGFTQIYRGSEVNVNLLPKIKLETVVSSDIVEAVIEKVREVANTGNVGDGKIFVYDVCEVVKIRTGERGESAI